MLRFENTAPVTFANDVTGVGTIELAGTAPVTFAGKGFEKLPSAFRTLQPGSSVDIPDCAACTIRLGAGDVDLGGATVALCGFSGNGRVSNGRLEVSGELNPAGTGAIGTLTFDAGVLVADGATFVCDVAKEGADKIVVEAPFDLSSIAFRTVDLGGRGYSQDVFCTAGLSGTFSATVFAKKWHAISYGGENVCLSAVPPGMLLNIR